MARRSSRRRLVLGALCAVLLGAASPAPPVDFENFAGYPAPPCSIGDERPPAFALSRGIYSWSTKAGDSGLDVQFRSVSVGHLRGDASTQAAVLLGCDFPNAMFDQWIDVFDVAGGTATFVAWVGAGSDDDPTRSARVVGNRLVVVTGVKKTYALRGSKLVPVPR
ncbi:MAG TPA: hypothetical protein VIG46_07765 [Candidatus Baltobacteraceae bacterium]|jgi:hypothetical protein